MSPLHIMEKAWETYFAHWRAVIIVPTTMFIISMIPAIAFPWSTLPDQAAPSNLAYSLFIVVQAFSMIAYIILTYIFMLEMWRIMKHSKKNFEQNAIDAIKAFPYAFVAHIAVIALTVLGAAGYLLLIWLITAQATGSEPIIAWPLILGLPLLAPAIYLVTRYMPAPLTVLLDGEKLHDALRKASYLTAHRWSDVFTRIFIPTLLWSLLNLIIILVLLIMIFIIMAIDPLNFSLSQSYAVITIQNIIETFFFMPLSTTSILILYSELKHTPKQ